ncbi:uncharacterized protein LOC129586748 [Paramacrobiotus metropolitanus]|uniref:uncharacterized protein LOC129586748 n=1 Tax=Paramacrobiotus metropolitanus TaxID=2943436 RepID=UPI0024461812|nr:uncharacterized protein LOC129586748 [Paramacrobiotus metropolitanus]
MLWDFIKMTAVLQVLIVTLGLSITAVLCDNTWNPFNDPFDWSKIRNAPQGFGKGFGSFGNGNNFGGFGSGGFGGNSGRSGSRRGSGNSGSTSDNNNPGTFGGFGNNGFGFDNSGFNNFADTFNNFQKQFGTQFPSFWPNNNFGGNGGNVDTSATSATQSPTAGSNVVSSTTASTTTTSTTTTTTATTAPTVFATTSAFTPGQDMFISSRNCTTDDQVIGISPSPSDQCGSVECQCFQGVYFCYSTCKPPPAQQTCDVIVAGNDICPQYGNCGPLVNESMGNANIFRCDPRSPTVHPSICWMYEILFGKLTAPLGFFESVSNDCTLAHHCTCNDGWVQPVQFKKEDFVTPANNHVFVRKTAGNKGAFASA